MTSSMSCCSLTSSILLIIDAFKVLKLTNVSCEHLRHCKVVTEGTRTGEPQTYIGCPVVQAAIIWVQVVCGVHSWARHRLLIATEPQLDGRQLGELVHSTTVWRYQGLPGKKREQKSVKKVTFYGWPGTRLVTCHQGLLCFAWKTILYWKIPCCDLSYSQLSHTGTTSRKRPPPVGDNFVNNHFVSQSTRLFQKHSRKRPLLKFLKRPRPFFRPEIWHILFFFQFPVRAHLIALEGNRYSEAKTVQFEWKY